ncbi:zinc finger, C3HC4 type (RING finger) protein [Rhizoctonia solani 123E]|uniref:RING-type E3 ubiquitin transferase n=1 Tax=Rhizoctonia solani 123E TaxID=1423351 RepID=A0A074S2M1_9AGAM|nr:zinc finger, C3HC4 type (RING finger) protein [Rhizoctonia solani 123E]
MSRPRPPLHDPYGLLRPPPPADPPSLYSATSNALGSTTSLALSTNSPNRRNRQRGISPIRTQHGEEYDDQPYLTNVVRHHGQVTLVPPVNQGRTRKPRRRRNPEATTSTVSLADTLASPSTSGPSRVSAGPQPRPRRPRQSSETRAVSSPDVRASPYPDYPPPSFEEVLALDRNNAPSSTPTSPPTGEPTRGDASSPMFLVSAPPSVSDPAPNHIATPWEHDRLLGLSLEERVRREFERTLKQPSPPANIATSLPEPSSPAPVSSSPTATSVTASNFLTPQNLSPSPSSASLVLSTINSPKASEPHRSPSPPSVPPKLPELTDTPTPEAEAEVSQIAIKQPTENSPRRSPFHRIHPAHQVDPLQETAPKATLPLGNSSPSRPPVTSSPSPRVPSPSLPTIPVAPIVPARVAPEAPQLSAFRRPPPPPPPRPRQRPVGSGVAARLSVYEALLANAPKVPPPIPPRPRPRSQITLDSPLGAVRDSPEVPTGATSSNAQTRSTTVGPGIEAFDLLGDTHITTQSPVVAQKPRLPPRPASVHVATRLAESPSRPASVALQDITSPVSSQSQSGRIESIPLPRPGSSRPERPISMNLQAQVSTPPRTNLDNIGVEVSGVTAATHTTTRPSTDIRPRSLSRPASVARQAVAPSTPASPQLQNNDTGFRSLPAPVPLRPERPLSTNVEAHALVPARIGPDGKLEIIPDAEVIWLDKPHAGTPEPQSGPSGSRPFSERSPPLPSVALEAMNRPPNREVNPFEDSLLSPPMVAPLMSRQSSATSSVYQPSSPIPSHPPLPDPGPSTSTPTAAESPIISPPHLADDFEYTDLDLLISRLEENEASRQGANYEQLLTVGEVLGPAHPPAPRPDFDLNVGLIEIQRRRVMKDGRVKLKLSLMGVGVDKCGICLTQFKNNENAVLLPCLHSFHTNCITSWFVRQDIPACPHCRAPITQ